MLAARSAARYRDHPTRPGAEPIAGIVNVPGAPARTLDDAIRAELLAVLGPLFEARVVDLLPDSH
jgi:hypothetical protein